MKIRQPAEPVAGADLSDSRGRPSVTSAGALNRALVYADCDGAAVRQPISLNCRNNTSWWKLRRSLTAASCATRRRSQRTGNDMIIKFRFPLKLNGAQKIGEWTGKNIGNYIHVLNDEVKSRLYQMQFSILGRNLR